MRKISRGVFIILLQVYVQFYYRNAAGESDLANESFHEVSGKDTPLLTLMLRGGPDLPHLKQFLGQIADTLSKIHGIIVPVPSSGLILEHVTCIQAHYYVPAGRGFIEAPIAFIDNNRANVLGIADVIHANEFAEFPSSKSV